VRENASQYHARVVNDFYDALVKGIDARNEAANVLFSAQNLNNHGISFSPLLKDAKNYLATMLKPTAFEESKTIRARSTKHEPARHPQHRAIRLFTKEQLEKAIEEGNLNAIDEMVRDATAWRHETRPNNEHHDIIDTPHHPVHAMGLFPNYGDDASYESIPVLHQLMRKMFSRGRAGDFNKAMKKAAKKLHPTLKKDNLLGAWGGNNFNIEKMFDIGFQDFKKDYENKFPQQKDHLKEYFVWAKQWENEGLPRDYIMRKGFDESGKPHNDAGRTLSKVVAENKAIKTEDGRWVYPSRERIGIDAYRDGVYMLPNDMIRDITHWKLTGAESQKELNRITNGNTEVGSYMALHGRVFNTALRHSYAGGALKRGGSHMAPNRYKMDSDLRRKLEQSPKEFASEMADNIKKGRRLNDIAPFQDSLLQSFDFSNTVDEYAKEKGLEITGGGAYPHHIVDELFGTEYIEMTDEIPDFKTLLDDGFFKGSAGEELLNDFAQKAGEAVAFEGKMDLMMESMNDFHYTRNYPEDWSDPKDAKDEQTVLGIMTEIMGAHGNQNEEFDDFGYLRDGAMPGVWFDTLRGEEGEQERLIVPSFRQDFPNRKVGTQEGPKKGRVKEKLRDSFKMVGDEALDEQNLARLKLTADKNGYSQGEVFEMESQFKDGKAVYVDLKDAENPAAATRAVGRGVTADMEAFTKDMPRPRVPSSDTLAPFVGAEAHFMADPSDITHILGMDGLHESHDLVSNHPLSEIDLLRANAHNKGHEKLFLAEHLRGDKTKRLDYDRSKPEHTLKIPIGLFGFHEPIDLRDDESLAQWKNGVNRSSRRSDPTNQGRSAHQIHRELAGAVDTQGTQYSSFYSVEEYQKYIDALKRGEFYAPDTLVHGALTTKQIKREIMANEGIKPKTSKASKLDKRLKEYEGQEDGVVPFGFDEHGQEYVIAPDISTLALARKNELTHQIAYEDDDAKRDILYGKINDLQPHISEGEATKPIQDHSQIARQTHDVTKEIFNTLVKPAFEHHFPGVFGEEGMDAKKNNDAWNATAYGLHIAEYIATNLTPRQRERLCYSNEEEGKPPTHGLTVHGSGSFGSMGQYIDKDALKRINELTVERPSYGRRGEYRDLSDFFPEHVKGHEVASHVYAKHAKQRQPQSVFDDVMKEVTQAAQEQGISFEDAFMARYYTHNRLEEPVKKQGPSRVTDKSRKGRRYVDSHLDLIENPKDAHASLLSGTGRKRIHHAEGGLHNGLREEGEEIGFLHGGNTVIYNGNRLSMNDEFEAISEVMNHMFEHTKGGSNRDILGQGIRMTTGSMEKKIFPQGSKRDLTTRYGKMRMLAHALGDETIERAGMSVLKPKTKLKFGGDSFQNAPLIPVYTSKEYMNRHGRSVHVPRTINKDALHQGNFVFQSKEVSPNCSPNNERIKLAVSRDAMLDVNPALQPHTFGMDNSMGQQTVFQNQAASANDLTDLKLASSDVLIDDSLIFKDEGRPPPVKFMHRIFSLEDMQHLRGFTGDWVLTLYPQGEHVIATKKGKKFTAYGADGEVKLDEAILQEKDKVYEKDFVVHAILHDGIMTVIDLLKTADEETHNMPAKDRIRHLRAQYESSEHIKMPEPINTKRSDEEGLQTAIEGLRGEQNIDILLRDANATYMKGEPRHPKWVLLSKEKMVDVIILSRTGKNYTVGVGPLMHPEHYGKRAQEYEGEHYMMIGNAKGPRGLKAGDFATVRCTGVSASKGEHPVYRIRAAKITDNEPLASDSVETLSILAGEQHVAQRVAVKKGKIIINFPAFDDDVICKTREEEGLWFVEPQTTTWGNEYLVRLAEDQRVYWEYEAALLLKQEEEGEPEYDEVNPEKPAGHVKKPKKVLEEEEEIIKRGLELMERGLEHLSKEKITSTGVQGLGIGYATPDEHPRGPTQNINDNTLPDFDPAAREDSEEKPATAKKTKRLLSTEGEEAVLEDDGVIAVK
jgi:hypothetical protein